MRASIAFHISSPQFCCWRRWLHFVVSVVQLRCELVLHRDDGLRCSTYDGACVYNCLSLVQVPLLFQALKVNAILFHLTLKNKKMRVSI